MGERWQFCWYGWRGPWTRWGIHRFGGSMVYIYRYRIMLGPLDIRRWETSRDKLRRREAKSE